MNSGAAFCCQWTQIAPTLTPLIGIGALLFAWMQLRLNRANQRETTAKATFREFLKLAVEHPELAEGNYESLISDDERQKKYEWFVGYLLWAAEEILEYAENDSTWQFNLKLVAGKHRAYFRTPEFQSELPAYSSKVRSLVDNIIQSAQH